MASIREPFGAVPRRLSESLAAGELTYDEFSVLVWIELNTNYRRNPAVWKGKTSEMAAAMSWPKSERSLSRVLKSLHDSGWIFSEVKERGRGSYEIRLLRGRAIRDGDPTPDSLLADDEACRSHVADVSHGNVGQDSDSQGSRVEPRRSPVAVDTPLVAVEEADLWLSWAGNGTPEDEACRSPKKSEVRSIEPMTIGMCQSCGELQESLRFVPSTGMNICTSCELQLRFGGESSD